jgi:hypothetical protein
MASHPVSGSRSLGAGLGSGQGMMHRTTAEKEAGDSAALDTGGRSSASALLHRLMDRSRLN